MRNLSILIVLAVLIIHFNCFGGEITTQEFVDKLNKNASTFCKDPKIRQNTDMETCVYRSKLATYACTANYFYIMPDKISEAERKSWQWPISKCYAKTMNILNEADKI